MVIVVIMKSSKSGASTLGEAGTAGYGTLRAGAREEKMLT